MSSVQFAQRVSVLYRNTPETVRADIIEFVLIHLSKQRAHQASGNLDNEESVSCLINELRYQGFKVGGHSADFEDFIVACGFKIRSQRYGRNFRQYVGI